MLAIEIKPSDVLSRKIAALRQVDAGFKPKVNAIVRGSAFAVVAYAKRLVPVSTGALRRSITPTFIYDGFMAVIGSWLPYARRQEYDMTLDHSVRPARTRVKNTRAGKVGSVIKGTNQMNPEATWGFMRKGLQMEYPNFIGKLTALVDSYGDAWKNA